MKTPARLILPILLATALAGCHTDPFGMKPEVRGVQIPDRSAEPQTEDDPAPEPAPEQD